eukprot:Stramenopile-MAST_4_protein_1001
MIPSYQHFYPGQYPHPQHHGTSFVQQPGAPPPLLQHNGSLVPCPRVSEIGVNQAGTHLFAHASTPHLLSHQQPGRKGGASGNTTKRAREPSSDDVSVRSHKESRTKLNADILGGSMPSSSRGPAKNSDQTQMRKSTGGDDIEKAAKNKKSPSVDGKLIRVAPKYRPPPLDTPEAIEKWRSERRKNWPTNAVIERKKAERESQQIRGDLREDERRNTGKFTEKQKQSASSTGGDRAEETPRQKVNRTKQNGKKARGDITSKHDTLLEMLLKNTIEREQSIVLQCFKRMVQHDFYRTEAHK